MKEVQRDRIFAEPWGTYFIARIASGRDSSYILFSVQYDSPRFPEYYLLEIRFAVKIFLRELYF
jgi:hypothetical protein